MCQRFQRSAKREIHPYRESRTPNIARPAYHGTHRVTVPAQHPHFSPSMRETCDEKGRNAGIGAYPPI